MTAATTIIIFVMSTIQSNPPDVTSAGRQYWYWFIAYIASLVFVAIVTLIFTLKSGELQDAIKADAEAKIAVANAEAAKANEGVANANLEIEKSKERTANAEVEAAKANEGLAKSNLEIARLTKEAETLRAEAESARADIARAQADAAKANEGAVKASAEVARLQIVVANAETKRAEAEQALLELQERVKPRHFTPEQRARFIALLKDAPKMTVEVNCVDQEACAFAQQIASALREAGWNVIGGEGEVFSLLKAFFGVELLQKNPGKALPAYKALYEAFSAIGQEFRPVYDTTGTLAEDRLAISVGTKP
jgi:hypothetical protein